jgi:hypothetical protein
MKAFLRRFICHLLILSSIALPYSAQTQAAVIGTEQAVASVQAQAGRDRLRALMERPEARDQLAARGLSPASASERVDALTDDEVQQLAGRIDALPAGGDAGIGIVGALLVVILVVLLVMLLDKR